MKNDFVNCFADLSSYLTKMVEVSFKTISHWESGYSEPSLELLAKLKNLLKVDYEDLLD